MALLARLLAFDIVVCLERDTEKHRKPLDFAAKPLQRDSYGNSTPQNHSREAATVIRLHKTTPERQLR